MLINNLELALILKLLNNDFKLCIQIYVNSKINWQVFYQLVIRHRICHQIYKKLKNKNFDDAIAQSDDYCLMYGQLQQFCYNDKLNLLKISGETMRIANEFNQNNLLHCFVKGIVLNVHIYHELTSRTCKDIDLWVKLDDYQIASALLLQLGYQQKIPMYKLNGFKANYYFKHKHDIAFYHPQRKIIVELHFKLNLTGMDFFSLNNQLLQRIIILNTAICTMKNDYHLLYLMQHAAIHGWIRLRWLNDIVLYLQTDKCNLNHLNQLALSLKLQHIVTQALILVAELYNLKIYWEQYLKIRVLDNIKFENEVKQTQYLVKIAKQFIHSDYEMGVAHGIFHKMFFIYRYYLVRLAPQGQKFNVLSGDLIKIDMLFSQVTLPDSLAIFY